MKGKSAKIAAATTAKATTANIFRQMRRSTAAGSVNASDSSPEPSRKGVLSEALILQSPFSLITKVADCINAIAALSSLRLIIRLFALGRFRQIVFAVRSEERRVG